MRIIADFETRSGANLRQVTAHRYATDPEADILCLTWCFSGLEPEIWWPNQPFPEALRGAVADGATFVFHNAEFDVTIWNVVGCRKYGFPPLPIEQVDCTAARAAAVHLPRALAHIGMALGLEQQKLADMGHEVLRQPGISMPRTPTKRDLRRWYNRDEMPEAYTKLAEYALQDIRATDSLDRALKPLLRFEQQVFRANMRLNARGLRVDVPLLRRVTSLLGYEAEHLLGTQLNTITDGLVTKLSQIPTIKRWLAFEGVDVTSLSESARAELLEDDGLSLEARTMLSLMDANKATVKKIPTMLRTVSPDGRVRGMFRYCGASQTMRFSGEKVQPQNLARPDEDVIKNPGMGVLRHELAHYSAPVLALLYGSVAGAVSNAIRTFFIPAPGFVFVAMDLSQIELRVLSWLAHDMEMLQTLASGGDPYLKTGADIFGVPVENLTKKSEERQFGKVVVLASGYQLGPATLQLQCKVQHGLTVSDELAKKAIKTYRSNRKPVVNFWYRMQDAAFEAITNPGTTTRCGRIYYRYVSNCLQMRLPSGHTLYYWDARISRIYHPAFEAEIDQITYRNIKGYTGGHRKSTYGGKLVENAVQSIARHILCEAMVKMDAAGLPLVLHAHDELVSEVTASLAKATHDYMHAHMTQNPTWAPDIPLEAEGWIGYYYRK